MSVFFFNLKKEGGGVVTAQRTFSVVNSGGGRELLIIQGNTTEFGIKLVFKIPCYFELTLLISLNGSAFQYAHFHGS